MTSAAPAACPSTAVAAGAVRSSAGRQQRSRRCSVWRSSCSRAASLDGCTVAAPGPACHSYCPAQHLQVPVIAATATATADVKKSILSERSCCWSTRCRVWQGRAGAALAALLFLTACGRRPAVPAVHSLQARSSCSPLWCCTAPSTAPTLLSRCAGALAQDAASMLVVDAASLLLAGSRPCQGCTARPTAPSVRISAAP